MKFHLIVALCKNNGIGINGNLPWRIKEDLAHFSKLTKGNGNNAVVMGRNTYHSLPKHYLEKRDNFIISSTIFMNEVTPEGEKIKTFKTIIEIINYLQDISVNFNSKKYDDIWIIGGSSIYDQFIEMGLIDKCYITYIDKEYKCDTFFNHMNILDTSHNNSNNSNTNWILSNKESIITKNNINLDFMEFINKNL
jgi:dihydrofolate reductase